MSKIEADFLDKYVIFCGDTYRMDKIIKAVGYAASLASCYLAGRSSRQDHASKVLHDVYSSISDARCVFRLLGTTDAVQWYRTETDVGFLGSCNRLQALMMALYHPLEHLSWLGFVSTHMEWVDPDKWCRWSDWCWVVYLIVDMAKVAVEIRELQQERATIVVLLQGSTCAAEGANIHLKDCSRNQNSSSNFADGYCTLGAASISSLTSFECSSSVEGTTSPEAKAAAAADTADNEELKLSQNNNSEQEVTDPEARLAEIDAEIVYLQLQLLRDILYFPNALHWGCEKPLLSKPVVATLGLAEAVVGLVQAWRKTDFS